MAAAVVERQEKPFQSNTLSESTNKDQYSSKKNEFDYSAATKFSSKDTVNNSLTVGQNWKEQDMAKRVRVKRNERGLASKTNIASASDNRYFQLTDRQFDDETSGSFLEKYLRKNNIHKHEPTNDKETLARSQNDTLQEGQRRTTADQEAIGMDLTNPKHRPPPGSQFYERTIRYPTSSVDDMYSRQTQTSYTRSTEQENSDSYRWRPGYTHARYRQSGRASHSVYCTCDGCFEGLPFVSEVEFDDLVDVPAYDDIPYALFMTDNIDKKTLFRARRKQEQQLALNSFKAKNEIKNASAKINKNKNERLQDMYKSQDCLDKSKSQSGGVQNHSSICESDTDVQAQYGNGAHPSVNTSLNDSSDKTADVEKSANGGNTTGGFHIRLVFGFGEAPTKNVSIKGQVTQNERPKSPCGVENKEDPVHDANNLTAKECLKEGKEDKKFARESKENETFTEKDKERFIRQKRLENLNFRASAVKNLVTSESIRMPDNRDIAVNVDKVNKPVKSKAFRSQIPLLPKEETPEQKGAHNAEDTEHRHKHGAMHIDMANQDTLCAGDQTKLCIKTDQNPETVLEDQNLRQSNNNSSGSRDKTVAKESLVTESSVNFEREPLHNEPSTSMDEVPSTMKLLIMTAPKKLVTQRSAKKTLSDNTGDDEKEPVAMRLLREARETKEMQSAFQGVMGRRKKKSSGPLLAFLFDFDSKDEPSKNYTTVNRKMLSDQRVNAIESPNQKNKNKNLNPLKQSVTGDTVKETEATRDNDQNDVDKKTKEKQVETGKGSASVTEIWGQTPRSETEAFDQSAINRHRAFQKLKMSESVERLKCTSCGRPECESQNIQKMKQIIRMAKQAGFEVRDVAPDGNCMFAAVVDQLQLYSDFRFTPKTLREAAVNWLVEHPKSADGTHYSSFVSEDWGVYIHRMMTEGEWGDHIVLRAVVEVVGHTVKILKVSSNEECWTTLEPASTSASKDGTHLVLAHVGEYHYTSLRPADGNTSFIPASPVSQGAQHPLITGENEQIILEGTETVEMFREDYIDPLSDLPVAHFSYMLRNVVPIKVLDTAAILQSQFTDSMANSPSRLLIGDVQYDPSLDCGGNIVEGIYVPAMHTSITGEVLDFDIAPIVFGIIEEFVVIEHESNLTGMRREDYVLDTRDVHPGYTRLKYAITVQSPDLSQTYQSEMDLMLKYQHQLRIQNVKSETGIKRLCAVRCPFWPECAQEWKTRLRLEGFPPVDMISSIVAEGCLLVPCSHKESRYPSLEWQFSFSLCEKKLFRDAVSMYQKYGYILFEGLFVQAMANVQSISSEHLKTVFFYACERTPAEYWESNPGASVMYMLDELLRYIRNKNLPNYFVRSNNMVDYLKEKDFKEIEEQIILLRSQLALFIRQVNENMRNHPHGEAIIDGVCDDIPSFKSHRSLKRSTLEVFVPATIRKAQEYIKNHKYAEGYEIVSQAFQERLSVSTCDDSVPFQMFLPGAVSGLDLDSLVWFSAYTDKQLEGQLSRSLIRETCGDLPLTKIKDILPADIVGSYGNTEVPTEFSTRPCSFCYEFAKFLYQTNKFSEILPILYHCHDIFTKKIENEAKNNDQSDRGDFNDHAMFNIYTAMFFMYKKQRQIEFFRPIVPVFESVVVKIHANWAYSCLAYVYEVLEDKTRYEKCKDMYHRLPKDSMENRYVSEFNSWVS